MKNFSDEELSPSIYNWEHIVIPLNTNGNSVYQVNVWRDWCNKNIGKRWEAVAARDGTWSMFWYKCQYEFAFKYEKDATLFRLRWS